MKLRFQVRRDYNKRIEKVNARMTRKKSRRHLIDEMTYLRWQKESLRKKERGIQPNMSSFGIWLQEMDYKLLRVQSVLKFYYSVLREKVLRFVGSAKKNQTKAVIAFCSIFLFALLLFLPQSAHGYTVYLNGDEVGMVREPEVFENSLKNIENDMSQWYDIGDLYYEQTVVYTKAPISKIAEMMDTETCKQKIYEGGFELYVKGVILYVDGQELASVGSKEDGEAVVKELTMQYSSTHENEKLIGEAQIDQTITMEEKIIPMSQIKSVDNVVASVFGREVQSAPAENAAVLSNSAVAKTETELADREQVMTAFSIDKDKFKTSAAATEKPLITIRTTKEIVYTQPVQYGKKIEYDAAMYEGAERIKSAGVEGEEKITAVVAYENGREISREIQNTERLRDPVDAVVVMGTMPLPSVRSSGSFVIPASGTVSAIAKPGSHGPGYAVDIANQTGTPIYASDSGVVVLAKWYFGYGNCIIINHAGGYSTLYGHLSAYKVGVGDTVGQGQVIGSMGNTGNSTGPHVHFAIRINERPTMIRDYFSFLQVGRRVTALQ